MKIGVATSSTGAAVRDILRVLGERWPIAKVVLRPCQVQGEGAAEQIVRALGGGLEAEPGLDLIILGRGGGSIEDLWAFNEEIVVRAVAAGTVPIITGIGHGNRCDPLRLRGGPSGRDPIAGRGTGGSQSKGCPAAGRIDLRAATTPVRGALLAGCGFYLDLSRLRGSHGLRRPIDLVRQRSQRLDDLTARLQKSLRLRLDLHRGTLAHLFLRWRGRDPVRGLGMARNRLRELGHRLGQSVVRRHRDASERFLARRAHLEAVGPRAVLSRGYAICLRQRDRRAVRVWSEVGGMSA